MIDIIYRFHPDDRAALTPPASPDDARRYLEEGNDRYADLLARVASESSAEQLVISSTLAGLGVGDGVQRAVKQEPFAAVLGCADARVPIELIFGQGYNDLFVVRVAGNVLGSECLGSIDYAVEHLGKSMKLLVVLGHTGCGAVAAAVDTFLTAGNYLSIATSHALRTVVDRIAIAVRSAVRTLETVHGPEVTSRPGYRDAVADTAVVINAALTAHTLEREFSGRSDCQVVYGVVDLATHRVGLATGTRGDADSTLSAPPRDRDSFIELMTRIVSTAAMLEILDGGASTAGDSHA